MTSDKSPKPTAVFRNLDVVIDRDGRFTVDLAGIGSGADLSFILDVYDLDNPVHPEGHVGWWRFEPGGLSQPVTGRIGIDAAGALHVEVDGAAVAEAWRNPELALPRRLELLCVLRSTITHAILASDRIPALRTAEDLAGFRAAFDRDANAPRYAPPHLLLPPRSRVHIVATGIFQRDGVGELCLGLYRMLRQHGAEVGLYADHFDLAMNDVVARRDALPKALGPEDIMVFFFSIHDAQLSDVLALPCRRRIAYFHGITAPALLQVFDFELSAACARGLKQLPRLAAFDALATNSRASAERLRAAIGDAAREIHVLPPGILPCDAAALPDTGIVPRTAPELLYVGRIRSHKRIEDLLRLVAACRVRDPSARLTLIGQADNAAYRDYLRWVQSEELALPDDAVVWRGSVEPAELADAYARASIYVSMSEDEGFCLPLVEAMARDVVVLAYDLPAVRETLAGAGVIFRDKDFPYLAGRIHDLLAAPQTLAAILAAQRPRAADWLQRMDGRRFLDLLLEGDG